MALFLWTKCQTHIMNYRSAECRCLQYLHWHSRYHLFSLRCIFDNIMNLFSYELSVTTNYCATCLCLLKNACRSCTYSRNYPRYYVLLDAVYINSVHSHLKHEDLLGCMVTLYTFADWKGLQQPSCTYCRCFHLPWRPLHFKDIQPSSLVK